MVDSKAMRSVNSYGSSAKMDVRKFRCISVPLMVNGNQTVSVRIGITVTVKGTVLNSFLV